MNQADREVDSARTNSSGGADSLALPVRYGPRACPLYRMIEWWAYQVQTYRAMALGLDSNYPPPNWPHHDFVGALHIRDSIDQALRPGDGIQDLAEPEILRLVDDLYIESTEPDDRGFLHILEPHFDVMSADPLKWWWTRFPASGAVFEEMLEMLADASEEHADQGAKP